MKSKYIVIVSFVVMVVVVWGLVLTRDTSNTDEVTVLEQQVLAYEEVDVYKPTIELYQKLIEVDSENVEWYHRLQETHYKLKQYNKIRPLCDETLKKFPGDVKTCLLLMQSYIENASYDDVIEYYITLTDDLKNNADIKKIYNMCECKPMYFSSYLEEIGEAFSSYSVIKVNGLYGYMDTAGNIPIKGMYTAVKPFIKDKAAVYNGKTWYFIDKVGDKVLATKETLEDLYSFSDGYAVAKINGKYGFVDEKFNKIKFEYDFATAMYNGVAAVQKNGKWSLINSEFEAITDIKYDDIIMKDNGVCNYNGILFVKYDGAYHMIDEKGDLLSEDSFSDAKLFLSSEPAAVKKNGKWGFIDTTGKIVRDYQYEDADSYNLGFAPVCMDGIYYYIDAEGDKRTFDEYQYAFGLTEGGVTVVKSEDTYRLMRFLKFE